MTLPADWIAVDWGTSALRAWAMTTRGEVLAARSTAEGMGTLRPEEFGPTLAALTAGWTQGPTPVLACGMVGSRQGWVEAAYACVPCPATAATLTPAPDTGDLRPLILPGVSQADPPDVMRGEETQIAGVLALYPGWDGVLCLPGTHTKWAEVSAGEIVSFRTVMTGELFALLTDHSVLRHSLDGTGLDETAFDTALSDTLSRPESLAARLFTIRARHLLEGSAPDAARGTLSGLLLGAELAATRPYWLGRAITVVGAPRIAGLYARALGAQGAEVRMVEAEAATLAGLTAAWTANRKALA